MDKGDCGRGFGRASSVHHHGDDNSKAPINFPICTLKDTECATCYEYGPVVDAPDIGPVCATCWEGLRSQFEEDISG